LKSSEQYIKETLNSMLVTCKPNELGKLFAPAAELFARDWINENTTVQCELRPNRGKENNQGGYDLVTTRGKRVQVKLRSRTLHLENTRRNSEKNQGAASKSGHVAYSDNEFDVAVFVRPGSWSENEPNDWHDTSKWEVLIIPTQALKDPKNPGFIRRSVGKKIQRKFQDKSIQTIELIENIKTASIY
jgi:hypothetical protein